MTSEHNEHGDLVARGYDAVFGAFGRASTLHRLWREHGLGRDFPEGFEHIAFSGLAELRSMAAELRVGPGDVLADVGCGAGGPGLWVARETGARLAGVDVSPVGIEVARERAQRLGMGDRATFATGTFEATGLDGGSVAGVMSCDAIQYGTNKRAAFAEFARILRPGGRLVFAAFETDPEAVRGVPVLGTDPVADYAPLLREAGFDVSAYEETPGWRERLEATYGAVVGARDALTEEMGAEAAGALLFEMALTLERRPYRRRVLVVASVAEAGR